MNELVLFFQQNDIALEGYLRYLNDLREAIDLGNAEKIAFNLEMLKGIYHLLEGNNINIRNLVISDRADLMKYFSTRA